MTSSIANVMAAIGVLKAAASFADPGAASE
jgi:hypothetical protein